jgi:hypothetical protein
MRRLAFSLVLAALMALLPAHRASAQETPAFREGMAMVQRTVSLAVAMRSAKPELEPINGQLSVSMRRLKLGFVLTIQEEGRPVWAYLHFLLPTPKGDEPTQACDAVFLLPGESASQFFEANRTYRARTDADFMLCMPEGFTSRLLGGGYPNPPTWAESDTRALIHLGGLLEFFATYESNPGRAADLARVGLERWREVLLAAAARGLTESKGSLALFDRVFPSSALQRLSLPPAGRTAARAVFQITVQLRRKLKPLAPEVAANLGRDEALLARYGGAL